MKLAVSGKGGVGKTTLTSLLAFALDERGLQVTVVDADPSPCLGAALGFPKELLAELTPLALAEDFVRERTGALEGGGGLIQLNPRVDDIPERFSVVHRGIRLLELGAVQKGGGGCICAESTLLRALVRHLLLDLDQVVLLDLDAGVEHLGRGTAEAVDAMLVVAEPTVRSLETAAQIRKLAEDIGIRRLFLVGNKVRDEEDHRFLVGNSPGLPLLGCLPEHPGVVVADRLRAPVRDACAAVYGAAKAILGDLERALAPVRLGAAAV